MQWLAASISAWTKQQMRWLAWIGITVDKPVLRFLNLAATSFPEMWQVAPIQLRRVSGVLWSLLQWMADSSKEQSPTL
jgi:hypothetical protein